MRRPILFTGAALLAVSLTLGGCMVPCPTAEPCSYLVAVYQPIAPPALRKAGWDEMMVGDRNTPQKHSARARVFDSQE
jgi:hypothetical protein